MTCITLYIGPEGLYIGPVLHCTLDLRGYIGPVLHCTLDLRGIIHCTLIGYYIVHWTWRSITLSEQYIEPTCRVLLDPYN